MDAAFAEHKCIVYKSFEYIGVYTMIANTKPDIYIFPADFRTQLLQVIRRVISDSERPLFHIFVSNGNTFKMASLIDNYEQQYAVLTADITAKIGRIRTQSGNEKRLFVQDVDRQIEEAQELLEQMELEVRGVNGAARDRLRGRVESHRAELKRLTQEFQSARKAKDESIEISREDSWENNITEDQKKRLLDTSEQIDRTGRTLQNGYRMVLETEEIGSEVLKELHEQRETIQKGRARLRDTDAELGRGSRLLSGMMFRSLQQRIVLAVVALTLIIVACIVMYYSFKSKS